MNTKQIIAASVAALALAISGAALAESETDILVSGDEPMNEGMAAEITEPAMDAAKQAKTAEMLKEEAGEIGGDMNPIDEGDAKQIKEPN